MNMQDILRNCFDIFSIRAFKASQFNDTIPLEKRFSGKKIMAVAFYDSEIILTTISFSKKGEVYVSEVESISR